MTNYKKLKENFLRKILKENSEMKVMYNSKVCNGCKSADLDTYGVCKKCKHKNRWISEKIISELSEDEKIEINLRKSFKNEIILDVEEKYKIHDIQTKLTEKNWSYVIWDTGSRGYHISILFDNFAKLDLDLRNRIRKYIITYFRTDEKLAKENQWLALEYSKHLKTGKEKYLYDTVNTNEKNLIDEEIIEYCKKDIENKKVQQIENKKIIVDFHLNDPYLKYAMNNMIENGDRNNTLFKNLAVGLVLSGLTKDEIATNYAQKIVENCPGKNVGEFMGWVDKAMDGQITEYNKSEMVQWSIEHDYPVMYELNNGEEIIDFYTIKQLWDKIWDNSIAQQPVWKELCFYNLLGTILDEKQDDLRVHLIFSSYSTSGKDEGVNLINEILERLKYITKRPAEVTDRTLLGAVNQVAVEFNTKNGLTEENQINGSKTYKNPIEKGWLENTHWLALSESESIFRPGAHNKHVQIILRQAMDKSRRIEKGVAGYSIPVTTNTSIVLTTYKMDNIVNAILHNGLFQRAIFYLKDLTDVDHKVIRKHIVKSKFNTKTEKSFNKEKYIMKLLEKLRDMKKWYEENKKDFKFEAGSDNFVDDLWEIAEANYSEFMAIDKEILNSMVRRESVHLYKLCVLDAVWRKQTLIEKKMIKSCYNIIMECIDSIKILVTSQNKDKKIKFSILKLLSLKGSMPKMQMHYELENRFKIKTSNMRSKMIKQLIDLELIGTFESGRNTMIMINEAGNSYLDSNEM